VRALWHFIRILCSIHRRSRNLQKTRHPPPDWMGCGFRGFVRFIFAQGSLFLGRKAPANKDDGKSLNQRDINKLNGIVKRFGDPAAFTAFPGLAERVIHSKSRVGWSSCKSEKLFFARCRLRGSVTRPEICILQLFIGSHFFQASPNNLPSLGRSEMGQNS